MRDTTGRSQWVFSIFPCNFSKESYHQYNKKQKIFLIINQAFLMKEALMIICIVLLGLYVAQTVVATGL